MNKTSSKPFWADASKRTGTWTAVAALAAVVEDLLDGTGPGDMGWEHVAMVGLAAGIRAIVALVQGKVGDPDKATFASSGPNIDVPKSALRDDPDVPDGDEGGS